MENFDSILEGGQPTQQQEFNKEEYKEQKQAERQELFDMANGKLEDTLTEPADLNKYLDMQSRLGKTSVSNTLLIMAQKPDASYVKGYDDWAEKSRAVKRNQKSIKIFEANGEYQREDGTMATAYSVRRVFDISQTYGQPIQPRQQAPIRSRVKALTKDTPVPIGLSDSMAQGDIARFSQEDNAIHVARGLDGESLFRGIAHELGKAMNHSEHNQFVGACAANIVCRRFGVPVEAASYIPQEISAMEMDDKRALLSDIRQTACDISDRVDLNLFAERQQQKSSQNREAAR